ncbi:MAG: hypothetical protein LPH21_06785, partial [Shewanella sp.]|nr:hypothetical protein [Shewanella sp.]
MDNGDAKQLQREFIKHDINIRDFNYHPPVLCNYKQDKVPTKVRTKILNTCRQYLDDFVEETNPELIITSHADGLAALAHKRLKVTSVRGIVTEMFSPRSDREKVPITVMGITNPSLVAMREEHRPSFVSDIRAAATYINVGYDKETMVEQLDVGAYEEIDDLQFIIDADPEYLSFDIEAVGLRPYVSPTEESPLEGRLMTLQFCFDGETGYVLPWDHPERKVPRNTKRKLV